MWMQSLEKYISSVWINSDLGKNKLGCWFWELLRKMPKHRSGISVISMLFLKQIKKKNSKGCTEGYRGRCSVQTQEVFQII